MKPIVLLSSILFITIFVSYLINISNQNVVVPYTENFGNYNLEEAKSNFYDSKKT